MHIINDFFLLIWKEDAKRLFSSNGDINSFLNSVLKNNYESFCDYSSIMLIVSLSNLDKLTKIKEARDAMTFLSGFDEWDKKRVQYLQKELLFFLRNKGDTKLNKAIEKRFDKLRKEGIIGYEKTRKLISLLALIEEKRETLEPLHVEKAKQGANFYESAINLFSASIANLQSAVEEVSLLKRLAEIPKKLKNEKFSIGITGVMNAGKSTMLNALLGKEILGTSVIPETANLTLIKYAKTPSAKVNFWDKDEWNSIENSSETLENMKPFIKDTKEHFKENLDEYITKEGRSFEINLDELPSYTSAEHSDKKCNLVKSVELYSDLKFVENGVEIVDTPGLDDPVIQREEITKNYLSQCDLMIHLMNVNQSATQKDIEFIIDTLLYQNVARLLIVITRIDTVSVDELEEVIAYTKTSIKTKLESLSKQNSFDSIIDKIDFIPLAGLQALQHRLGKTDENYPLEQTGILKVEDYLSEILFGSDSQKANLIIDATKKELSHIINGANNSLHVEKSYLGKSALEIENEHTKYKEEIHSIKQKISDLKQKIVNEKDELVRYFLTLENFSKNKFLSLQAVAKRRVIDDVSYEIRKNKTKPEESRIASIIETALKDGFIDILRDYRYQFSKKIEAAFEKIEQDFDSFTKDESRNSDAKEFFEKHFADLNLVSSNAVLITQVNNAIKSHSKKDIDGLSISLETHFETALKELYEKFNQKVVKINEELVYGFESELKKPLEDIAFDMDAKEEILNLAKKRAEDKSFDASKRLDEIELKISVLKKVEGDLK
jgi:predicted GTPase